MANNINITVTEILGTDSMNNSRVTINNNFKTLATAINAIGRLVSNDEIGSPTTPLRGRELRVGDVVVTTQGITIGEYTLTSEHIQKIIQLFDTNQLELINDAEQGLRISVDNGEVRFEITGDPEHTICTINENKILTDSGTGE